MRFVSGEGRERDEVTIQTISRLTGKSTIDIIEIGKNAANNEVIDFGDFKCTVLQHLKPKKRKKKTGLKASNQRKLFLTDVISADEGSFTPKRIYRIDGEVKTLEEVLTIFGVSRATLHYNLRGIKSATANGHKVVLEHFKYVVKKDPKSDMRKNPPIKIENVVFEESLYKRAGKIYFVDGVQKLRKEIAFMTNCSESSIQRIISKKKSVTINGVNIEVRPKTLIVNKRFTAMKDGVKTKGLTVGEAEKLTGIKSARVYVLVKSKKYDKKGWRFYEENK